MSRFSFRRTVVAAAGLAALTTVLVLTTTSSASRRQAQSASRPSAAGSIAVGSQRRTFVSTSGNDANPCTRTQPCRSFGAAIAQTSSGGEVIVLDSGGYGQVTIGQSISLIAPPGVYAGITALSGDGITVTAGTSDIVILRGLTLTGLGGSEGIQVNSVGTLQVEDTTIRSFGSQGINVSTSADANVFVDDTVLTGNGDTGITLAASSGVVRASLDHVRVEDNASDGIVAAFGALVTVRDSVAARNTGGSGFFAQDSGTELNVENSVATENSVGLNSVSPGTIRASNMMITDNATGLAGTGSIVSWVNNRLAGNTTAGSFTSTISQQ